MFGQRLHDLRTENGYTQETLGEKLGVSPKTIGTWERGTREPPMKAIDTLAKLFDVSADYLMGRSDKRHYYDLSTKETTDIAEQAQQIIDGMNAGASVNFYGEPMTDEQKQSMKDIIEMGLRINKEKAKKKFTPKKFRGQDGD